MKKFNFLLMALIAIFFASCNKNGNTGKACYEIEVQFSTLSTTEMFYGEEDELQAEIASLREKYKAMHFDDESIKIYSTKLNKSKEECTAQSAEIVRTVKPTASFKMTVTGINPEGYSGGASGARAFGGFKFSCRYVQDGGHTSTPMMELRQLFDGLQYSYTNDSWGSNNYVHDNSYVGGRIVSMSGKEATENPTDEDKDFIRYYAELKFQGSNYDFNTGETTYYNYTPDGPFQLKKTCQWTFRNGRGETFNVIDEVIDTFNNSEEFIDSIISHTASNPLFQSLYYYDAEKDEFILQDRTSWKLN